MHDVGSKIKRLRELKNIKQEDMAHRLGMSQPSYSRLESGETKVDLSKLEKIAQLMELKLEEILSFDEKQVFNIYNNTHSNNGYVNNNNQEVAFLKDQILEKDREIKRLWEQIELLQKGK
jgi:transcriptional regulator with XRE-family HTH domain